MMIKFMIMRHIINKFVCIFSSLVFPKHKIKFMNLYYSQSIKSNSSAHNMKHIRKSTFISPSLNTTSFKLHDSIQDKHKKVCIRIFHKVTLLIRFVLIDRLGYSLSIKLSVKSMVQAGIGLRYTLVYRTLSIEQGIIGMRFYLLY